MADKMKKTGENFDVEVGVDTSVGNFPEGIHRAKCVKAVVEENKAKDSHNLVLDFEAVGGEYEGRRIRNWLSFKDTVRWKMTEALNAFGIETVKDKKGVPKARLQRDDFVGEEVRLQVSYEDYMGEQRPQVDKILPLREEGSDDEVTKPSKASVMDDSDDDTEEEDNRRVAKEKKELEDMETEEEEEEEDDDSPEDDLPF